MVIAIPMPVSPWLVPLLKIAEGHAVTDTALSNQFAHPHDECGASDQAEYDDEAGQPMRNLGAEHDTVGGRLEQQKITDCIDQTQCKGKPTGGLGNLLAARFAFTRPTTNSRDNALHQLHDDGCGDVGHDAQRKDAEVRKGATREDVNHRHRSAASILIGVCKLCEGNTGYRNVCTQTVQSKDGQRKQNLVTQLLNLECFDQRT